MGDRQALLSDLYEAYNRKDIEAVVAALHPEIDWPALFSEARIQGAEAVRQLFTEPFKVMNPEITPIDIRTDLHGRIRVRVSYVVRTLDGIVFTEETNTNLFELCDKLIIRMDWA